MDMDEMDAASSLSGAQFAPGPMSPDTSMNMDIDEEPRRQRTPKSSVDVAQVLRTPKSSVDVGILPLKISCDR